MSDKQKNYNVIMHDDAAEMLYSHVRFLSNVSVSAARKLRDTIFDASQSLVSMPHRCPPFNSSNLKGVYRQLIVGRYQIVFSISEVDNIVSIRYILDSRQNNDI